MSQTIFTTIDPAISGTTLATTLNNFKDAIVSGISGTSRPATLLAGGCWVDTTLDPVSWSYKMYTGSTDVEIFKLNLSTSIASVGNANSELDIKRVSADTTGAILKLIKQRIASSGQVADGDVVGEIRFVGRANDASSPVVSKIIWTSTDAQTATVYGGTLSFQSVPDASGTLTEHFRLISGLFETVVPHKLNSLRLVSQDIATAATISQASAAKVLAEMTGSTACSIQGINSGHDSQVVTIHNRSSANVTLKHQDTGATAADRLKLPTSADYILIPDASATLYYCTTDTRWKLLSTADRSFNGYTTQTFYGPVNSWTATTSLARVRAYRRRQGVENEIGTLLDVYGNAYAWGTNINGQLGVGDVTGRSSPVAVVGGITFSRIYGGNRNSSDVNNFGISNTGAAYAWGINLNGQLGLGDVVGRSSPVAVLGGLRWNRIYPRDAHAYGLTTGYLPYAWGNNTNGELGVGDVVPRSSPVAVLGGLSFSKLLPVANGTQISVLGLTKAGALYAWGYNAKGQLGNGDLIPRSSPVAVLGGLTFSDVYATGGNDTSFYGLTNAGAAYAWGANSSGQLGIGDLVARSSPVAVIGGITFSKLIAHPKGDCVYGLSTAGILYAWGLNVWGQLGVGDVTARSSPVAVLGGITFTKIYPRPLGCAALDSNGVAYSWGINSSGNLGVGDVVARSSPVAVLGGQTFETIVFPDSAADAYAIFGILADGQLYAWGGNSAGTLGVGDTTPRSSPVAVLGGLRADLTQPTYSADLTLTSGQSYTVLISDGGIATFGNIPLGLNIAKVEIEYLQ